MTWSVFHDDDDYHIIPDDDVKKHSRTDMCWCNPSFESNILSWVHHSADKREAKERQ